MLRPALAVVALALALPAGASAQYEVTRPILFASCFGAGCPSPPYVAEPPYNYPSQLGVAGAGNYLTGVRVTLSNIAHGNSQDLDTLLVGPGGQKAIVESDIGGSAIADTWTFDDFAASEAPRVASSGTWKPTNWDEPSADTFPPAFTSARNPPAPPYPPTLAGFFGTNPNGEWRLYTVDDDPLLYGTIGNGWRLDLETGPGNPALIAAASDAPSAATYPAQLPVSGLSGEIADVDVNLTGLSHAHPDDLDVVLVSPQGQKVMLTSDAGGAVPGGQRRLALRRRGARGDARRRRRAHRSLPPRRLRSGRVAARSGAGRAVCRLAEGLRGRGPERNVAALRGRRPQRRSRIDRPRLRVDDQDAPGDAARSGCDRHRGRRRRRTLERW
jgi:subtilisin-like proprotein convertase family protein